MTVPVPSTVLAGLGERLADCPFCGGAAKVGESQEIIFAGCVDPDCLGHRLAFDFVSEENAIAAWNRRAPSSELLALREKLTTQAEANILAAVTAIKSAVVAVPAGPFMDERLPSSTTLCKLVRDAVRKSALSRSLPTIPEEAS